MSWYGTEDIVDAETGWKTAGYALRPEVRIGYSVQYGFADEFPPFFPGCNVLPCFPGCDWGLLVANPFLTWGLWVPVGPGPFLPPATHGQFLIDIVAP